MSMDLFFPPLNGGIEQGLNHAGIETFEGEVQRHIVRECTQNALDARLSGNTQARVEINLRQIDAVDIPGLTALRAAIQSSQDYWKGNEKTDIFCRKALEWTASRQIAVLEVSDYGTTGLEGADGDRNKSWFGLVQSGGVSIKPEDAAGAFGIGKDAPFAGSFIRTVLYSSLNKNREHAFQGVSKLTTHLDEKNQKTQATGFIGSVVAGKHECKAVRISTAIPEPFRRRETGTSIFVLAYRHLGGDDWMEGFIREAVRNFWPAIYRGSLVFQIGSRRVDGSTLPSLMSRYSNDPDFVSRFHYRSVADGHRIERRVSLPHLGECKLCLVPGDATYPKKICMTRQTGMVIYEASRFRSYRPFAGLFICESTEGNSYLRKLEPPRHDRWDSTRADDPNEAASVLQGIRDWINQCLRELNPNDDAKEVDVPDLNRYLPDEEDEPLADEATGTNQPGGYDGIVTTPLAQPLLVQEAPPRPPVRQPAHGAEAPLDGHEDGSGAGDGSPNPSSDETASPDGRSDTTGGGATGATSQNTRKSLLQTRAVRMRPNVYDLIVRSAIDCEGRLALVSVGEDNSEDKSLEILEVVDLSTKTAFSLENFVIKTGQVFRLRVTIDSTIPLSFRAYCHGN